MVDEAFSLRGEGLRRLTSEGLADLLKSGLPEVNLPDRHILQNEVSNRCIRYGIDGNQLLQMVATNTTPGKSMRDHLAYRQLFDGTDDWFSKSSTAVRGSKVFAELVINKLILANLSVAIAGAEQQVFSREMIPSEFRNRAFDAWYTPNDLWCIEAGPQQWVDYTDAVYGGSDGRCSGVHGSYTAPAGWMRFALDTRIFSSVPPEVWAGWHKAYHGTAGRNVKGICTQGLKFMPSLHGAAGGHGKNIIYASPCIEYSAHWVYTTKGDDKGSAKVAAPSRGAAVDVESLAATMASMAVGSGMEGALMVGGHYVQWVFEVRVKPGSYRIQGNTLGGNLWGEDGKRQWNLEFDKFTMRHNLEWLLESDDDIVCTAVMMRDIPCDPEEYNRQRYEAMKRHVGWNPAACRPTRPREFCGRINGPVQWDWNSEPPDRNTLTYSPDAQWTPFDPRVSKVIEDAYQGYQRFAFVGKPPGAPGPYFIDFGSECDPDLPYGPEQRRADADKEQAWRRRAIRRRPV